MGTKAPRTKHSCARERSRLLAFVIAETPQRFRSPVATVEGVWSERLARRRSAGARRLSTNALAINASAFAASERETADEAIAMVKKAAAYLKANGKEKAFAEFSNPKGQFVDRNRYIFAYDLNGNSLAIGNGNAAKMAGKNLLDMRDADGVYLIKNFIEIAKTKGKDWSDYKWPNPANSAIEHKSSHIEKVDDIFLGCGTYK